MKGRHTLLMLVASGLLSGLLASCDLLGGGGPEEVRLLVEGTPSSEVQLVTTTNFLAQKQILFDDLGLAIGDTTIVLIFAADTQFVQLPFEQVYDIRTPQRFLVRVTRMDLSTDLRIRAWVDGENRLDRMARDVPQDSLIQYLYFFTGSARDPDEPPEA